MQINKIVDDVLSEDAVELLNTLAAHAIATTQVNEAAMYYLPIEEDDWDETMFLIREIFEAEIVISGDQNWLSFRILQSLGVNNGRLAYQFTPTFAQALSLSPIKTGIP